PDFKKECPKASPKIMERENEIGLSVPNQKIDRKVKVLPPSGPEQNFVGPLHAKKSHGKHIGAWRRIIVDIVKRAFGLGNMAEHGGLGHRVMVARPGMPSIRSWHGPAHNTDPQTIDRCQKQHSQYLIY